MRDFLLSGAELQGQAKIRFAAIQERLAELGQQFSEHVLDATDGYALYASAEQMAGVPDDVGQQTRASAAAEGQAGHKLTLHMPVYLPVMQYAQDSALREQLYHAYATRASEFGPADRDNSALMAELLQLRAEEAGLLGYGSYGELSLVPKMAESPQQVTGFLRDLARRARPHAERDLAELRAFAAEHLDMPELKVWDQAFVSEKLKQARYAFSELELKQYFTEPRVLEGLFKLVETLFEVHIHPDSAPSARRRGPATPYSRSPAPRRHFRKTQSLTPRYLRHRLRPHTPNPIQTSAFPRAHPMHAPKHYFARSATPHSPALAPPQNPVGRLRPPGRPRGHPRPTQKCRKSPCGHNGPLCGLADKNSRSQGRGQGRASGWPRWDPLPLLLSLCTGTLTGEAHG